MKKRHVYMIVNTYAPDDPRVIFSASSLVRMGYHVRLIGAARQAAGGKASHQTVEGVEVLITPMMASRHPLHWLKMFWRVLRGDIGKQTITPGAEFTNLISMFFFSLWILRLGLRQPIDVVHAHDLSPLPAAWLLARIKRTRLIYDVHENVPTMYSRRKSQWMAWLERQLISRADHVITAGIRLESLLYERGAKSVTYIGNWKRLSDYQVSTDMIDRLRHKHHLLDGKLVVLYIGTLDPPRELLPLLEAVEQSPDVCLLIGGRGILQAEVQAAADRVPHIYWLGWVSRDEIPVYTCLADALYYCLDAKQFGKFNYYAPGANKVFEAFAAGVPIMIQRGVNEIADLLETTGGAIILDTVTVKTIRQALRQMQDAALMAQLRQQALAAREQYNWSVAEARLAQIYGELTRHKMEETRDA